MARLGLRAIRKPHVDGIVTDKNGNQIHSTATGQKQEVSATLQPPTPFEKVSEMGSEELTTPFLKPEPNLTQSVVQASPETDNKLATRADSIPLPSVPYEPKETGNKSGTNREQIGNKSGTNWEQIGNKKTTAQSAEIETGNKLGSQPGTDSGTNWEQIGNKLGTKSGFLALGGLQRETVLFIYSLCRQAGSRITESIRLETLAHHMQTTTGSIKETIKRLVKKGLLERETFRVGRGGFSSYRIPEIVYRELYGLEIENKLGTNREQTGNKLGTQPGTQPGTTPPCSSSILNNLNTTTTTDPPEFLKVAARLENEIIFDPNLWHGLNFSKLVKYVFQAGQWVHSVTDLQEMLDGITAVIESKKSTQWPIDNPLRFLHACLTKWHVDVPSGYKSRREREAETKKASFEKERDQFLQDHRLLGHREIQTKIETVYTQKYSDRNKPGWGMNLKILQREFLNELYVRTRGYTEDVLVLLGGQGMKKQLGIEETAQSLGLDQFIQPRIPN